MGSFTVAKYLRISSEDKNMKQSGKMESDSIANQRNLLSDFLDRMPEFEGAETLEFCDDGWSGRNFERPAVRDMLEKVKCGEIQCIVVKDDCVIIELNAKSPIKCGFCAVSSIF